MAEVIELSIDFDGTELGRLDARQIFEDNLRTEVAEALSIPKDAVIIHAVDVANGEIQLGFLAGDAAERRRGRSDDGVDDARGRRRAVRRL